MGIEPIVVPAPKATTWGLEFSVGEALVSPEVKDGESVVEVGGVVVEGWSVDEEDVVSVVNVDGSVFDEG